MTWGGIGEIFNPGQRHMDEELASKRVEAQVPGDEGRPNRVDLDAGIVRITRPAESGGHRATPGNNEPDWSQIVPTGLDLAGLAGRLVTVDGVVGVVLGGSRARGAHHEGSDVDLGIYYRGDLDVAALAAIARDVGGPEAEITRPGEWGPWVDGGGWLVVDGVHVDWIYRDVDRVQEAWTRAHRGTYDWNAQAGHPLGVPDFAYVGELALAVVLADPEGELAGMREAFVYPAALATALVQNLWEAHFLVTLAGKATSRGDAAYVALCLGRALLLCAHALHGHDRRWLVNEKGAIATAGELPSAPEGFARRAQEVLGGLGTGPSDLDDSVARARRVVEDVASTCREDGDQP
ncbi:MAG: nucleotidyltransferase domain-containing protein [Lapillicoccus sp.]